MSDMLTIEDIRRITGKSERTVYRWIEKGKITCQKVSDSGKEVIKIPRTVFERFWGTSPDIMTDSVRHCQTGSVTVFDTVLDNVRQDDKDSIHEGLTPDNIRAVIEDVLANRELQLIKPLEEVASYQLGRAMERIDRLEEKLQEADLKILDYQEKMKLLPAGKTPEEIAADLVKIVTLTQEKEALKKSLQEAQEAQGGIQTQVKELSSHVEALKSSEATLREETAQERAAREQAEQAVAREKQKREAAELARMEAEEKIAQEQREREVLATKLAEEERCRQEALKEQEVLRQQVETEAQEKARIAAEHQATLDRLQEEERMRKAMAEQLAEAQRPWWKKMFGVK